MANQEQLDILKQGVQAWNEWREKNSSVQIDLREADLRQAHLIRVNLSRVDLFGANLSEQAPPKNQRLLASVAAARCK